MICPNCNGDLRVLDTISTDMINHRHRKCKLCGFDFYTQEKAVEPHESEHLFREWSRERRKKSELRKKGISYEPKFSDGREIKKEPKPPIRSLF